MSSQPTLTVTGLSGIPEVREGDNLATLLHTGILGCGLELREGDIIAVSSKIASKALGLVAHGHDKAAVIARESVAVLAERAVGTSGYLTQVVRAAAGPVMAAAGVDASNTGGRDVLLLLPHDPDAVCRQLHAQLAELSGVSRFGVLLTDTAGRPWRIGQIDFAVGAYGLHVLDDLRGSQDADGRRLTVTARAVADELAAAADLVKGKASGVPAALIRGAASHVLVTGQATAAPGARWLVGHREGELPPDGSPSPRGGRADEGDWFALGSQEAVRTALGVPPGSDLAVACGIRPVSGDCDEDRIGRAVRVAVHPQVESWHAGVVIVAHRESGRLQVTGSDAFRVGFVVARLLVALAGEDVPHRIAAHGPDCTELVRA
ncbi:MAG: coenzyme F420-0:L-glutamate ligase [Candidatus Phosphoribacter sp.]|nr:coenzyme F420-0:L-glutamate ligase [Actinomycetales bacterium]